jgi:hypothetical protein
MTVQSNFPLPITPQLWKAGQFIYYFNQKDNGIQKPEDEGKRYEADFTIIKAKEITNADIEKALIGSILDTPLEQKGNRQYRGGR